MADFGPIIPPYLNFQHPLNRGLVGCWLAAPRLGMGTEKWYDISGHGNHGTLTNMDPATDWVGTGRTGGFGALDFPTSNDHVTVPKTTASPLSVAAVSVVVVARPTNTNTDKDIVTDRAGDSSTNYGARLDSAGKIQFMYNDGSWSIWRTTSACYTANEWQHFAITANSGEDPNAYVNASAESGSWVVGSGSTLTPNNNTLRVSTYNGTTNPMVGQIADIRIYNRALSAKEVQSLYQESLQGYPQLLNRSSQTSVSIPASIPDTQETVGGNIVVREGPIVPPYLDFSHPLNRGLVGCWLAVPRLGMGTEKWYDISGHGNHGELTNMDPASDWVGTGRKGGFGALDFDGTDDQVVCGTSASLEVQTHTMCAWVVRSGGSIMIAGKSDNIVTSGVEWAAYSNGVLQFAYNDGSIRGWYQATSAVPSGTWTYASIVWRQAAGQVDFFMDGKYINSVATTTGTIVYASDTFDIAHASLNDNWLGKLDDIRIYNRALSAKEVQDLYLESLQGYPNLLYRSPTTIFAPLSSSVPTLDITTLGLKATPVPAREFDASFVKDILLEHLMGVGDGLTVGLDKGAVQSNGLDKGAVQHSYPGVGRDILIEHILSTSAAHNTPVEHLLSLTNTQTTLIEHLLNISAAKNVLAEHILGLDLTKTAALEHILSVLSSRQVSVEHLLQVSMDKDVVLEHLIGLGVDKDVLVEHILNLEEEKNSLIEHAIDVTGTKTATIEHLLSLLNSHEVTTEHLLQISAGNDIILEHIIESFFTAAKVILIENILNLEEEKTGLIEHTLGVGVNKQTSLEHLISIQQTNKVALVEHTLALSAATTWPIEHILNLSLTKNILIDHILSVSSDNDILVEHILDTSAISALKTIPIDWVREIQVNGVLYVGHLLALGVTKDALIEHLIEIDVTNQDLILEHLQGISDDTTIPIDWIGEISDNKTISTEHLLSLSIPKTIVLEYLIETENVNLDLIVEHLGGISDDNLIPIEYIATAADVTGGNVLCWILSSRNTQWVVATHPTSWVLPNISKSWILDRGEE